MGLQEKHAGPVETNTAAYQSGQAVCLNSPLLGQLKPPVKQSHSAAQRPGHALALQCWEAQPFHHCLQDWSAPQGPGWTANQHHRQLLAGCSLTPDHSAVWGTPLAGQVGGELRRCPQGSGGRGAGMGGLGADLRGDASALHVLLLEWICAVQPWAVQPASIRGPVTHLGQDCLSDLSRQLFAAVGNPHASPS